MKTTIRTTYIIFVLGLVLATQAFAADVSGTVSLGNYQLISKTRVDRVNYDYVFKASATNKGATLKNVSATLVNPPSGTSVLDSALSFGDLAAGATAASSDTFSFRQNRLNELKPEALSWKITGDYPVTSSGKITGFVADTLGGRVANVEVRLGTKTVITHTDNQGNFTANFGSSEISNGHQVLVSARASGYVDTQTKVALGQGAAYNTSLVIKHVGVQQQIADPSHASINLSDPGKVLLRLDAGTILDTNNQPVTEPVRVQVTALDPTNPAELAVFPGRDFLGFDPNNPSASGKLISLKSVVFADVKLIGDSGNEYHHWSSNNKATLDLSIPAALQGQYTNGQTIPLWFYDDNIGLWQREGDGTVFLNSADNRQWVKAHVSHFTPWNIDIPVTCPDGQFWDGSQCVGCPDGQYWNGWQCNTNCASDQYWNGSQCVSICPEGQQWNGSQCVSICPEGQQWNGSQCVSICPDGQQWNGSQCVSICPDGQQWNGSQCVSICPDGQQWNGSQCVSICPEGQQWNGSQCVSICPEGQQWNGSQCVCPEGLIWDGAVCIPIIITCEEGQQWNGSQCVSICAGGQQWNGSQCVSICPDGQQWNGMQCITDLVLWNKLGSISEVQNSEIGPPGSKTGGNFMPGIFGEAYVANYYENGLLSFPASILPTAKGTIEFWGKLIGFPADISNSGIELFTSLQAVSQVSPDLQYRLGFAVNDGCGGGGVHGTLNVATNSVCGGLVHTATGGWGSPKTYESILGSGKAGDWHHYALVWGELGIPGVSGKRAAVFVDGNLATNYYHDGAPLAFNQIPTDRYLGLVWNYEGQGSVAIDNLKIRNFAKTDFSDRFMEFDLPIDNRACIKFNPQNAANGNSLSNMPFYIDGITYNGLSLASTNGDEKGVTGKLTKNPGNPEKVRLMINRDGSNYYLKVDSSDSTLFHLIADPNEATSVNMPDTQGDYGHNPGNCNDLDVIKVDLTTSANSPPNVTVNDPMMCFICGQEVTITADVTDIDNNLPVNPNPVWQTDCGNITSASLTGATFLSECRPEVFGCNVSLSVADVDGATGNDSVFLTFCGGDPCQLTPGSPECCLANPSHPSCDPCQLNPGSPECCSANPSHPSCDPCQLNPGSPLCCATNPTYPGCDPCIINPGSYECCSVNPSHSSCDPCAANPGSPECCTSNPSHPSCGIRPTCSPDQILIEGECVNRCTAGFYWDGSGCVNQCGLGFYWDGEGCVTVCVSGTHFDNGRCVADETNGEDGNSEFGP